MAQRLPPNRSAGSGEVYQLDEAWRVPETGDLLRDPASVSTVHPLRTLWPTIADLFVVCGDNGWVASGAPTHSSWPVRECAMTSNRQTFFAAALRRPAVMGAVAPSSSGLADLLAAVTPTTGRPVVVELGPGTGVVSEAIGRRLPDHGRHVAVEIDAALVTHLADAQPRLEVVHGDAADLTWLLADRGIRQADAVISGLPWSLFKPERQRLILNRITALLAPTGAFTTFAYRHTRAMTGARTFHRLLTAMFDEVIVSHTIWWNMPPARIYVCRRPLAA
jgi:phosphatidylethanolamine/phosphatidyl-N-methylethanolamine N-methyltransferase